MHTLPDLPYPYEALEPSIDSQTMHLHHDKHHATYVEQLNKALDEHPELHALTLVELLSSIENVPENIRTRVINHAGGHSNHSLFWESLSPETQDMPEELRNAIGATFGSVEEFATQFKQGALSVFGSGWAWLTYSDNSLKIITTPNQNSPYMTGHTPLLGIDVWEHAYYLTYTNKRAEYLDAIWNIINWQVVHDRYRSIKRT